MIAIFPEIVTCVGIGDLERLSILVRRYFAKHEAQKPNVDIRALINTMGIEIQSLRYPELASLLARDEKGHFEITMVISDRALAPEHERFLLAHMLGHYLLHVQPKIANGEFAVSGFRETDAPWERYASLSISASKSQTDQREYDADKFAAALLMPKAMVLKAQTKLVEVDRMAAFFGVSKVCMEARLEQVNTLPPRVTITKAKKTEAPAESTARPRGMDRIRQLAKLLDRDK